jgi:hypothetical protein
MKCFETKNGRTTDIVSAFVCPIKFKNTNVFFVSSCKQTLDFWLSLIKLAEIHQKCFIQGLKFIYYNNEEHRLKFFFCFLQKQKYLVLSCLRDCNHLEIIP